LESFVVGVYPEHMESTAMSKRNRRWLPARNREGKQLDMILPQQTINHATSVALKPVLIQNCKATNVDFVHVAFSDHDTYDPLSVLDHLDDAAAVDRFLHLMCDDDLWVAKLKHPCGLLDVIGSVDRSHFFCPP
jgi:hypothetical protein